MPLYDDETLQRFEAEGSPAITSTPSHHGWVPHNGARIWYADYGEGSAVILLHGGLGHSGNWGNQVDALVDAGYRVLTIDSRGHGRSTRDDRPFTYQLMASDVLAVMDQTRLATASLIGWSDGACTALILANREPHRIDRVFFFACNMDPSGAKPLDALPPIVERCFHRHVADYQRLSATPDRFTDFHEAVSRMMKTEPNYSAQDLARISVPVTVALGEYDEFIHRAHAEYLACNIPRAKFVLLEGVSHFAPLQRPTLFNQAIVTFLKSTRTEPQS